MNNLSNILQAALVFAARYSHNRNTGAATVVCQDIKEMLIKESHKSTTCAEDWEGLRAFATGTEVAK